MDHSQAHRSLIRSFTAVCLGIGAAGVILGNTKINEFAQPEHSSIREHGIRVVAIRDGMRSGGHSVSPVTERYVARVEEASDFRKHLERGDEEVTAVYADSFIEGQLGGWDPQAFERYAGMVANSPARIAQMLESAQDQLVGNGYSRSHSVGMTTATVRVAEVISDPDRPEENFFSAQISNVVSRIPDIEGLFTQSLEMRTVLQRASVMEATNDADWSRPVEASQRVGMDL